MTIHNRAQGPEELDLRKGDVIQVLVKEDKLWWFGRLPNGNEGYFPSACVTTCGPVRVVLFLGQPVQSDTSGVLLAWSSGLHCSSSTDQMMSCLVPGHQNKGESLQIQGIFDYLVK